MKLSAIILAGGESKRMNYNKEFIKIDNEYLIHKQIKTLQPLFDEIIIVTNNPTHYKDCNVVITKDILEGKSPIIGLHAGLEKSSNDYNFILACDMPNIDIEYIKYMIGNITNHDAYVIKRNGFLEPFQGIYHKRISSLIEDFTLHHNKGFQNFIKTINTYYINDFELPNTISTAIFKNINNEQDLLNLDQNHDAREYQIIKMVSNVPHETSDIIVTEYPLEIHINQIHYTTIVATPSNLELLVLGYLNAEELISSVDDVLEYTLDYYNHKSFITIKKDTSTFSNHRTELLSSACAGNKDVLNKDTIHMKVSNNETFDLSTLLDDVAHFNKESILFKETGGVHSVKLVYDQKELLIEDIGRHNAVDKIVGFLLKNKIDTKHKYIITSGRISSDIVLKCALAQIPLIISRSAPTSLAINLAKELNITVLGFARGDKVNIYTHQNRIKKEV
jgi:formate dehydrogenase accessory protein FdhD